LTTPSLCFYAVIARDTADVPSLQEEVIWAWEATVVVEATRVKAVHAVAASSQEAITARERAEASIKEAEAKATSTEREARERLSKVEAESTASLASARGEASELTLRVAFLEGELADACQTLDTTEVNFQELSDGAVDVNRTWEDAERQCWSRS
jgi:chromosome segregation ATPase